MHARKHAAALFFSSFTFACATAGQGTKPQDMTAAEHEAAAQSEEAQAGEHAAQYSSDARTTSTRCGTAQKACWTSLENPTAQHAHDSEQHRTWAVQHRAASQALVAAEQRACAGVPEEDRDMSPFRHKEDISSVAKLEKTEQHGKVAQPHLKGATVTFRAVPGLTEQWLQRIVDCHLARNAAMGDHAHEMDYCPLALKGASASVRALPDGFAVDVSCDDPKVAEQILKRAEALRTM
jgi:hypothetical protein